MIAGDYHLVNLSQSSRNFRKWDKGNLPDKDVIGVGIVSSNDWAGEFQKEIRAIRKKLKNYPNRVHT
jgi:hypothetical protein